MFVAAIDFGTSNSGWAFSFSRWLDEKDDAYKVTTKHWYSGSNLVTEKAPTIALISPDGKELVAFGYDAENQYTILLDKKEHEEYYYFKEFKMSLNKKLEQTFNRDITIEDSRKKSLPAMRVFSLTIAYLVNDMLSVCNNRLGEGIQHGDVHWVLTVPAIWTDSAKQFMMEAAIEAGISAEKLSIVLEPEAASVYCRNIPLIASYGEANLDIAELKVGTKYLVVDAGGGTIDITAHEVQESGYVKEIHAAGGGGWGGTMVNQAFENMMRDIVGNGVYDKFVKTETEDWLELCREFEIKKKDVGQTKNTLITMQVPVSLIDLYEEDTKTSFIERIRSCKYSKSLSQINNKLKIDQKAMVDLFEDSVAKTVGHMKIVLENENLQDISAILMVGGFSDSPLLQNAVKSEFKHLKVVIPRDAATVVLKGAVILGHKPDTISARILKYTYGYEVFIPFEKGIHPEKNKTTTDHGVRCKDGLSVYARKGKTVSFREIPEKRRITPVYKTQTSVGIPIYATQSDPPPVVIDESLSKIGKLTVKLEDHDGDIDREIIFTMDFSATTIKATAFDQKTGNSVEASLDFLG